MLTPPIIVAIVSAVIGVLGTIGGVLLTHCLEKRRKAKKGAKGGKERTWLDALQESRPWCFLHKWRATIQLIALWWGLVGLFVGLLHGLVAGKLSVFDHVVSFDVTRIVVVIAIAIIDLFIRWRVFRRIQSISLDILIFAVVYRLVIMMSRCTEGGIPVDWNVYLLALMAVLLLLGGSVYWLYKESYIRDFKTWFQNHLSKHATQMTSDSREALKEIVEQYKHVDLWEIFQQDETSRLRRLVNGLVPAAERCGKDEVFALSLWYRMPTVAVLSILAVFAVYLNALA
jgi:hypothetical protein